MDEDGVKERQLSSMHEKEFSFLLPVAALIGSANSRAAELHYGFEWQDEGWRLQWPNEVITGMGLWPSNAQPKANAVDEFRVLFEPVEGCKVNFWYALFGSNAPALVMSYEASLDKPPFIYHRDDDWLHWPWYMSEDERLATLDRAIAVAEDVKAAVDWFELVKVSATGGPSSTLFTGVAAYFARQNP